MTCKKTEMYVCIMQRSHSSLRECNVVPAFLIETPTEGGKSPVFRMPVQHGLSPSPTSPWWGKQCFSSSVVFLLVHTSSRSTVNSWITWVSETSRAGLNPGVLLCQPGKSLSHTAHNVTSLVRVLVIIIILFLLNKILNVKTSPDAHCIIGIQ